MNSSNTLSRSLVSILAYPVVIGLAIALHYVLVFYEVGLIMATYAPVILGAVAVTFLEIQFPHRKEWWADKREVMNDAVYMAVVQVLWPRLLSFFLAVTLLQMFNERNFSFENLWPHSWPIPVQAVVMVLSADFLRYWLHRFAHEWPWLWRFHAVHHSPQKLYWVNVGRFHFVDKGLQFLFDALPFVLLGVREEVLALYFVFYSINGFFQHCNVDVRLGVLNHLISGPELHRWHHSRFPKESNQNYGNNLIIWDSLFGTRFLPEDREVGELGLKNREYPMGFLEQIKTPFIKGSEG